MAEIPLKLLSDQRDGLGRRPQNKGTKMPAAIIRMALLAILATAQPEPGAVIECPPIDLAQETVVIPQSDAMNAFPTDPAIQEGHAVAMDATPSPQESLPETSATATQDALPMVNTPTGQVEQVGQVGQDSQTPNESQSATSDIGRAEGITVEEVRVNLREGQSGNDRTSSNKRTRTIVIPIGKIVIGFIIGLFLIADIALVVFVWDARHDDGDDDDGSGDAGPILRYSDRSLADDYKESAARRRAEEAAEEEMGRIAKLREFAKRQMKMAGKEQPSETESFPVIAMPPARKLIAMPPHKKG